MEGTEKMIKLADVSFSYGDKVILQNLNLEIAPGDRVYITGKSGIGKTTLLNIILGLQKPSEGVLDTSGVSFSAVFQEDRLLPFKSVRDNVRMFATCTEEETDDILKGLDLFNDADRYPSSLSGGMSRRASIARSLAHGGDVFIFDEPFNGLDEENISRAVKTIEKYTKGKTLIAVIHKSEDAEKLSLKNLSVEFCKNGKQD